MFLKDFYDNLVEIELKIDFFCEKLAITACDLNQIMAQKKHLWYDTRGAFGSCNKKNLI
jgi:phage antirepressor YoqD-like protein